MLRVGLRILLRRWGRLQFELIPGLHIGDTLVVSQNDDLRVTFYVCFI